MRALPALSLALATALCAAGPLAAQIVVDGTTDTVVTLGAGGEVNVRVAPPAAGGLSHNRYDSFSVPKAGAVLDNRTAAARTILNEVTGSAPSRIEGALRVEGQLAHVVVANPNGITIDGGRFVNTGRVALTTGPLTFEDRQIAPGIFQRNAVTTVRGGTIVIEGGGLSGQMDALDLIAEKIRVGGPVEVAGDTGALALTGGWSVTEFNSAILPGNTSALWSSPSALDGGPEGVMVEVLRPGVLGANRIGIAVTGAGAGVRMAGGAQAGRDGFRLSASGDVLLDGARIASTGDAVVTGRSVTVSATDVQAAGLSVDAAERLDIDTGVTLSAEAALLLTSGGALNLSQATLRSDNALLFDSAGPMTLSSSSLRAAGHLTGAASAITLQTGSELVAENGALIATTRAGNFTNLGSLVQGGQKAEGLADAAGTLSDGAVTLNVAGDLRNVTATGTDAPLAILFGAAGDLSLTGAGNLANLGGRLVANGDVRLRFGGDLDNAAGADLPAPQPVQTRKGKGKRSWWAFWMRRPTTYRLSFTGLPESHVRAAGITAQGAVDLRLAGDLRVHGADINANGGDIAISAASVTVASVATGALDARQTCGFTCRGKASGQVQSLGGQINAAGAIDIATTGALILRGGSLYALSTVAATADRVLLAARQLPMAVRRPDGIHALWSGGTIWAYLRDLGGTVTSGAGDVTLAAPVTLEGGAVAAAGSVTTGPQEVLRRPGIQTLIAGREIGLFRDLPGVGQ